MHPARWPVALWALLIVLAAVAAFASSFQGAMVLDDHGAIILNTTIRDLASIGTVLSPPPNGGTMQGRPLVNLTLAVNYALGWTDPWGYHAVNLLVHVLAALTLFGIVRRTLLTDRLRARFAPAAAGLAAATAMIWAVHPLQTESVTYICQRAESIMGLFFLLTLYCAIRSATSPRPVRWMAAGIAACTLGMASKEVMAGAPIIVLLYDRTFLAGSFGQAIRRRWGFYAALAATWGLLGYLVLAAHSRTGSAGLGTGVGSFRYACTQGGIVLHYLKLCFWPRGLVLAYGWPAAKTAAEILPGTIAMVFAFAATVWGVAARKAWGMVGAWFFVILAPSSSFIPIADLAFEHRMYLPLAAVVVLTVLTAYVLGEWTLRRFVEGDLLRRHLGWAIAVAAVVLVTAALGRATAGRNYDYRSELAIWDDTVHKRPNNPIAWSCRGSEYLKLRQYPQAISDLDMAIRMNPLLIESYNNRGNAYAMLGQHEKAILDYERAIQISPGYAEAYNDLGHAYEELGRYGEAMIEYGKAILIKPDYDQAYYNRGNMVARLGDPQQAVRDFNLAIHIDPHFAEAYCGRGAALGNLGEFRQAVRDLSTAIRLKADYAKAYENRARAYYFTADYDLAWADIRMCRKLGAQVDPGLVRDLAAASGRSE